MQLSSIVSIVLFSACRTDESDTLARINQLESQISRLERQLDESRTTINALEETVNILDGLSDKGTLTGALNALQVRVDTLEKSQQEHSDSIDGLIKVANGNSMNMDKLIKLVEKIVDE